MKKCFIVVSVLFSVHVYSQNQKGEVIALKNVLSKGIKSSSSKFEGIHNFLLFNGGVATHKFQNNSSYISSFQFGFFPKGLKMFNNSVGIGIIPALDISNTAIIYPSLGIIAGLKIGPRVYYDFCISRGLVVLSEEKYYYGYGFSKDDYGMTKIGNGLRFIVSKKGNFNLGLSYYKYFAKDFQLSYLGQGGGINITESRDFSTLNISLGFSF